jgi:hypothetical protein
VPAAQENRMAHKFVVGLFQSKGIAEDAINRLKYEGVAPGYISELVLHETAPPPPTVQMEIEALSVDPLILGNVRESYAPFIHNGETAIFVRAHSEEEVDLAIGTIRQYSPIKIKVVTPTDGQPLDLDIL